MFETKMTNVHSIERKKLTRTKVSVYFKDPNATRFGPVDGDDNALKDNWECVICGASNRSGSGKCTMCGVKEQLKSKAKPKGITEPSAMHGWVCTSCTLINPPANERCEACERPRLPSRHKIEGAGGGAQARYVRLSLRFDSGGTGAFVEYMRKMIFALKSASSRKGDDKERDDSGPPALGIPSVVDMFDKKQQWITSTLESGSGDLNSLMTSVYDIIEIVKSLTKSINNLGGYEDDKESVLISEFEECLASIGLNLEGLIAPQPSNMLGSDKKSIINKSSYYESLATELANFLSKLFLSPDKRLNPIVPWSMAVSEVYLAFNITRGRDLISPKDLMKSLDILKRRDSCQFTYKVFESDLAVVCTKQEDYTQIISALSNMVSQYENGVTAYDLSNSTGIPFFLALEYLYIAEKSGTVCRDCSICGVRFYKNLFFSEGGGPSVMP